MVAVFKGGIAGLGVRAVITFGANDDVWLKAMSLKKGVLCKKVKKTPPSFFEINFNKKSPLNLTNVHESHNDICIDNVWKHYFNTK